MIGVDGPDPNHSGGMVPSVGPPFAMTRWVPQTRENYVSMTPYNVTDTHITGFQATHQPAIWMGESGQFVVVPGVSGKDREVKVGIEERGMRKLPGSEKSRVDWYEVGMEADNGVLVKAEMTASMYSPLLVSFHRSLHSFSQLSIPRRTPPLHIHTSTLFLLLATTSLHPNPPHPILPHLHPSQLGLPILQHYPALPYPTFLPHRPL
jgi:putative alpha-1,2-mannosidase